MGWFDGSCRIALQQFRQGSIYVPVIMRRRAASLLGGRLAGLAAEQQTQGLATSATSPAAGLFGIAGRASRTGRNVAQQQARGRSALPAAAAAVQTRVAPQVLPLTRVDEFGATSILESEDMAKFMPQVYQNVDGQRIEDGRYAAFTKDLTGGLGVRGAPHGAALPAQQGAPRHRQCFLSPVES